MTIWIAILLLLDAGFALLFEDRVRARMPGWNVKVIAFIEAAIALVLIIWHFR
ncbi:MAG: hypothetical protein ACO398_01355 [Kiritimatiellia bacterium]